MWGVPRGRPRCRGFDAPGVVPAGRAVLREAIQDRRVCTKDLVRACKRRGVEIEDFGRIVDGAMSMLDRF